MVFDGAIETHEARRCCGRLCERRNRIEVSRLRVTKTQKAGRARSQMSRSDFGRRESPWVHIRIQLSHAHVDYAAAALVA